MIKIDWKTCTIDEIVSLKNDCENYIENYEDGYLYICNVRSYGRNWQEELKNVHQLEQLCYNYNGYDGIVDVYSTNPDLNEFYNYGQMFYIKSKHDYERWKSHESLVSQINEIEKMWAEWDNKENVPFNNRPKFEPYCTKGELEIMKGWLKEFDMSFEPPKRYTDTTSFSE